MRIENGYGFWKIGVILKIYCLKPSAYLEIDETKISELSKLMNEEHTPGELLTLLPYVPEEFQMCFKQKILEKYMPIKADKKHEFNLGTNFVGKVKSHLLLFPSIISSIQRTSVNQISLEMFDLNEIESEHLFGFMSKPMTLARPRDPAALFYREMLSFFKPEHLEGLFEQIQVLIHTKLMTPTLIPSQPHNSNAMISNEKSANQRDVSSLFNNSLDRHSEISYEMGLGSHKQAKKKGNQSNPIIPESMSGSEVRNKPLGNQALQPELLTTAHFNMRVYEILSGTLIFWLVKCRAISTADMLQRTEPSDKFEQVLQGLNVPGEMATRGLHLQHPQQYFASMPLLLRWSHCCWTVAVSTGNLGAGVWRLYRAVTEAVWVVEPEGKPDYWKCEVSTRAVLNAAAMVAIRLHIMFASVGIGKHYSKSKLAATGKTVVFHEMNPVCPNCNYLTDYNEELFCFRTIFACEDCSMPRLSQRREFHVSGDQDGLIQSFIPFWTQHLKKWKSVKSSQPPKQEKAITFLTNLLEFVCSGPYSEIANNLSD